MKEFKGKSVAELKKLLDEKREALRAFRFGMAGSKTRDVKAGVKHRKDIARILTEMASHEKNK